MKEEGERLLLSRLRAALTPCAVALLAALLLVLWFAFSGGQQAQSLESRIGQTLSQMEGAGRVEVTICMREVSMTSGIGAARSETVPCGAVAVAQGADDPLVALALHEALCALLGLPPSSVSIMVGGK